MVSARAPAPLPVVVAVPGLVGAVVGVAFDSETVDDLAAYLPIPLLWSSESIPVETLLQSSAWIDGNRSCRIDAILVESTFPLFTYGFNASLIAPMRSANMAADVGASAYSCEYIALATELAD